MSTNHHSSQNDSNDSENESNPYENMSSTKLFYKNIIINSANVWECYNNNNVMKQVIQIPVIDEEDILIEGNFEQDFKWDNMYSFTSKRYWGLEDVAHLLQIGETHDFSSILG